MMDRFGRPLRIGFAEYELIRIRAAMTLPQREKLEAFHDIADLSGRTFSAVYNKSRWLVENDRSEAGRKNLVNLSKRYLQKVAAGVG